MHQEKQESSPFAALSYEEQQRRWMAWRSRQLDYQPARESPVEEAGAPSEAPLRLPQLRDPAPTQHRELDQVLQRHRQALRRAGAFQPISGQ